MKTLKRIAALVASLTVLALSLMAGGPALWLGDGE